jgi:hypothetical protein
MTQVVITAINVVLAALICSGVMQFVWWILSTAH